MVNNANFSDLDSIKINTQKSAEIIEFKRNITQFELTKTIYESEIFSKIKMTASSKLFLWALCTHFNPNNEDMFPSQATVAKKLGMSTKSAERAVKELGELGLISWTTKKVNHYNFSEKFFALVKMSVKHRQNVGSDIRQNVGLTNKHEQKNNTKNFSFSKFGSDSLYEKSGKKAVPSCEATQNYIKKLDDAAKNSINPWNYSKEEAIKWIKSAGTWVFGSSLAKFLVKKYELVEFYYPIFGKALGNAMIKHGVEYVENLAPEERESLEREEQRLLQIELVEKLNSCNDF